MIKRGHPLYEDMLVYINEEWHTSYKSFVEPPFMWRSTIVRTGESILLVDSRGYKDDGGFKRLQNGINKKVDNKLSKKAHKLYKMVEDEGY